jgi:hypothetical protein
MKRFLGVLALAATLVMAAPALASADGVGGLCGNDPNCTVDEFGSDTTGFPGWFVGIFVLVVLIGIGTTIYRVSAARSMARKAGLDQDAAGAVALLEDNGLSAAYVASSLHPRPATPGTPGAPATDGSQADQHARPAAERLAERQSLKDAGAITESEYAARRQAIIDSI